MDKYTTLSGYEIGLVAIPYQNVFKIKLQTRKEFEEAGKPIIPPTYEVQMFGGNTVTFAHDDSTTKTEEEQKAWEIYKRAIAELSREQDNRSTAYILDRGIIVDDKIISKWAKEQKKWGLEVPSSPLDRKLAFLDDALADFRDLYDVTAQILRLSMSGKVTEEAIAAAEAMFRHTMEEDKDATG